MIDMHTAHIEGVGFWAPTLPGWPAARAAFCGAASPMDTPAAIPSPVALPSAERRRAPATVALALAVSEAAIKAAGRKPNEVLAVFTSAHGDLPAIDYLCATLAHTPMLVSPTRFLHSIHNSPLGIWSVLAANGLNHTAVSAAECSFAAGLLEALMLVESEQQAVLLVGYDTAATGGLVHTTQSQGAIAVALVLSPSPSPSPNATTKPQLTWCIGRADKVASKPQTDAASGLPNNGMTQALPLFEALAAVGSRAHPMALPLDVSLDLSCYQQLHISLCPVKPPSNSSKSGLR